MINEIRWFWSWPGLLRFVEGKVPQSVIDEQEALEPALRSITVTIDGVPVDCKIFQFQTT
jgi:hypothetical protein